MPDPDHEIPLDRLPEGFAESLDRPPREPAPARPAATVVLLRPGPEGVEALLLRRNRRAGFVPGAWVFPGGRVDRDDAGPDLLARLDGVTAESAATRLGLPDGDPPAVAYWVAAIREAFEETGLLVGRTAGGGTPPTVAEDAEVGALRDALLEDEDRFPEILDALGARMDGGAVEYFAHWITPLAEPRRYDTRFFAAAVPVGAEAVTDDREMVDAAWLTPEAALDRHGRGELPMVFPTIETLRSLRGFSDPAEALDWFRGRGVPTVLPRIVRTPTGVGMLLPDPEEEDAGQR